MAVEDLVQMHYCWGDAEHVDNCNCPQLGTTGRPAASEGHFAGPAVLKLAEDVLVAIMGICLLSCEDAEDFERATLPTSFWPLAVSVAECT